MISFSTSFAVVIPKYTQVSKALQTDPKKWLVDQLAKASTLFERAQIPLQCQLSIGILTTRTNAIIAHTQAIIEKEATWEKLGLTKEQMWETINYVTIIRPAIE